MVLILHIKKIAKKKILVFHLYLLCSTTKAHTMQPQQSQQQSPRYSTPPRVQGVNTTEHFPDIKFIHAIAKGSHKQRSRTDH